jgi:hypothetical protein
MVAVPGAPDWAMLWDSAVWSIGVTLVLVIVAAFTAGKNRRKSATTDKEWDFSDSWASNVTVGSAALAAVFVSSDVVTAVGGEKAVVAPLVVVASALSLAAVTAAPLVVKVFTKTDGAVWTLSIAAAAVLTLWGTGLQGMVIVRTSSGLDLGGIQSWTWLVGAVLGLLLAIYAVRSLSALFTLQDADSGVKDAHSDDRNVAPRTRRRAAIL